ncbi:MAG: cysteine dioxygenase [Spirulinaceae cyanobacterium]
MVHLVERTTFKGSKTLLPASLQSLIAQIQHHASLTPARLRDSVQAAQVQPHDLWPWADFEHPVTDGYGRQLVYDGGSFEIMVMSWREGDFSAIHDHGATEWGVVQSFGQAAHYTYQLEGNLLTTRERCDFVPREIKLVDHDLIHQMGNGGSAPFLSLHVYGCDRAPAAGITGNARIFDLWEHCIQYTDGGVFFALPEQDIRGRTPGIRGDRATTRRHHQQLRDRLERMVAVQPEPGWCDRLTQLQQELATL